MTVEVLQSILVTMLTQNGVGGFFIHLVFHFSLNPTQNERRHARKHLGCLRWIKSETGGQLLCYLITMGRLKLL